MDFITSRFVDFASDHNQTLQPIFYNRDNPHNWVAPQVIRGVQPMQ